MSYRADGEEPAAERALAEAAGRTGVVDEVVGGIVVRYCGRGGDRGDMGEEEVMGGYGSC